ncbi:hypothetical protein C8A00DRAFT_18834 [Chaetomidium leptoderma]|uniref:Uncharacterized protein n=1 Tax=Chaetomidium leptoderma TaxID=669021 RepID=A0AAN6VDJ8_9PEZI|nr:hypothetical protein C8A00DRAFT_18834 [Chaetomidium leptoderma]
MTVDVRKLRQSLRRDFGNPTASGSPASSRPRHGEMEAPESATQLAVELSVEMPARSLGGVEIQAHELLELIDL